MNSRPIRFTSQWALVGVISFYAVATAMIAWHRERIVTPTSAGGSECTTMPEMPNLPEPSRCDASRRVAGDYWYNSATGIGLIPSDEDGPNLELFGDIFGTEQFSDLSRRVSDTAGGSDTNETPPGLNIEKTSYIDTVITSTTAIQALTKIRTKAKCVETILKKAVIEPYHINGQIEGLRITGLDKILLARDLLLKSGDIIRAVNGHPLNSKQRAYEIFKKARKLPIMKIELLRDGKTETLLYYLR
ncbi:MAG: hypothetical protein ABIL62_02220 [Planctomycetota bacterium]